MPGVVEGREKTPHREEDLIFIHNYIIVDEDKKKKRQEWQKEYDFNRREKRKQYRIDNREKLKVARALWKEKNAEKLKETNRLYRLENKEKARIQKGEYRNLHREEIRIKKRLYDQNRRANDPLFKIRQNLNRRIRSVLFENVKSESTMTLLGCSLEILKQHLESQFVENMNWDNYGKYGWHIDHIRPCASFDLSDPEQLMQCFHYTNLQPLWWFDNLSKQDKYEPE